MKGRILINEQIEFEAVKSCNLTYSCIGQFKKKIKTRISFLLNLIFFLYIKHNIVKISIYIFVYIFIFLVCSNLNLSRFEIALSLIPIYNIISIINIYIFFLNLI